MKLIFLLSGIVFGFILIKSGVSNYDVIRDMFLLRSIHLYGVLGGAVPFAFVGIFILKKLQVKALLNNEPIDFSVEKLTKNSIIGGLLGGTGWAITGACPGPAIALIGYGTLSGIFIVAGSVLGTYLYGLQVSD